MKIASFGCRLHVKVYRLLINAFVGASQAPLFALLPEAVGVAVAAEGAPPAAAAASILRASSCSMSVRGRDEDGYRAMSARRLPPTAAVAPATGPSPSRSPPAAPSAAPPGPPPSTSAGGEFFA